MTARASTAEILAEGVRLVECADAADIRLRLLGGVAVVIHCEGIDVARAHRDIADIDAIVGPGDGRRASVLLGAQGYEPDERFNALHGNSRMIFHGPVGKLDLFIGAFQMCHRLELASRLTQDVPTLPVSDLLLTKLQVVEMGQKDAHDLAILLRHHELAPGPGDRIDTDYLGTVLAADWGLWRTATGTLEALREQRHEVASKVDLLLEAIEATPKSRRYKLRAKVGERKRWYELPEEIAE